MSSRQIVISSGNINLNKSSWKKGNETADEELYQSLKACIEQHTEVKDHSWENGNAYEFLMDQEERDDDQLDRSDLKVTTKIFLYSLKRDDILAAIHRGLKSTSVEHLDTLVFAISGLSEAEPLTLDMLKTVWSLLEELVAKDQVKMIGLCDVDTQLFIKLFEWASVKPSIVQINLASCCVVPPELSEFCKQQSLQLLTHSDPINMLSEEKLGSLIKSFQSVLGSGDEKWQPNWILRYQVNVKSRGILTNKGYVACISGASSSSQ